MASVSDKTLEADAPSMENQQIRPYTKADPCSPQDKKSLEILDFRDSWLMELEKLKTKIVISKHRKPHPSAPISSSPSRLSASNAINKCKAPGKTHGATHKPLNIVRQAWPPRHSGGQCGTQKITADQFHASSILHTRQHENKMRILRVIQNRLKSAAATCETTLPDCNNLPQHSTSNGSRRRISKKHYFTSSSNSAKERIGRTTKHDLHTDSEKEQYVGHPFYIDGDHGTQQSKDVSCSPSKATSFRTDKERSREKYFTPKCVLSPSLFPNVAPYLNFASHLKKGPNMPAELHRVLKWKSTAAMPLIVRRIVLNSGFRIIKTETDWTGTWDNHMRSKGFRSICSHQKFNHMPGSYRLGRKDTMWWGIHNNIKKFGSKEFGFMQKTYLMPADMQDLQRAWPKYAAKLTKWIVKPPARSRGVGIRIVNKWGQFSKDRPLIVQKYIERPLLINDSKFDMRLYVVVTSIHPLKIYMYKDGLARFASKTYSTDEDSLNDRCMHLTNYSINKYSDSYSKNTDFNTCQGHKWTLQSLWCCLEERGVNTKRLWATLRNLVIKAIISGEPGMNRLYRHSVNFRSNCYELFGFDVLLDENMVPWLLEVNISPSLNSDLKLDRHVKGPLVQALLNTALYQVSPRLDEQQQSDIIRELNLNCTNLCMDKRLFATCLSDAELDKHNIYTNESIECREQYLDPILEKLNSDDVRCLILAEDELHRCTPLERIFPTAETHTYIRFMEKPRYYNRLLDAWENRYGNKRAAGIALLEQLCKDGYHLQIADPEWIQEPAVIHSDENLLLDATGDHNKC